MHALIVSLGSAGRRHLRNLRRLEPDAAITVWRRHSRDPRLPEGADQVVFDLSGALAASPAIAIVAGPASDHFAVAKSLAGAGVALFIEKPLAAQLDEAEELIALCRANQVPLMTGYNLRFHPGLRALRESLCDGQIGRLLSLRAEVGQYLPDWRGGVDYRNTVSACRALGGGVLLELSHEFDYVRWIAGEVQALGACTGKLSDLEIDVEDHAEIVLRFASGALGSLHLDMAQRAPVRLCRVAGTEGTLLWDGIAGSLRLYRPGRGWEDIGPPPVERNAMFEAELAAFLDCVRRRAQPPVTGEDGRRALQIALACNRSAAEQRMVEIGI